MTRARPSPSRLHLLPAMRLVSHLLPREPGGRLLAKIHAKKNRNEIGARAEDLYKQMTVCPYERIFISYLFVVQRTQEMWQNETVGGRAEDL